MVMVQLMLRGVSAFAWNISVLWLNVGFWCDSYHRWQPLLSLLSAGL